MSARVGIRISYLNFMKACRTRVAVFVVALTGLSASGAGHAAALGQHCQSSLTPAQAEATEKRIKSLAQEISSLTRATNGHHVPLALPGLRVATDVKDPAIPADVYDSIVELLPLASSVSFFTEKVPFLSSGGFVGFYGSQKLPLFITSAHVGDKHPQFVILGQNAGHHVFLKLDPVPLIMDNQSDFAIFAADPVEYASTFAGSQMAAFSKFARRHPSYTKVASAARALLGKPLRLTATKLLNASNLDAVISLGRLNYVKIDSNNPNIMSWSDVEKHNSPEQPELLNPLTRDLFHRSRIAARQTFRITNSVRRQLGWGANVLQGDFAVVGAGRVLAGGMSPPVPDWDGVVMEGENLVGQVFVPVPPKWMPRSIARSLLIGPGNSGSQDLLYKNGEFYLVGVAWTAPVIRKFPTDPGNLSFGQVFGKYEIQSDGTLKFLAPAYAGSYSASGSNIGQAVLSFANTGAITGSDLLDVDARRELLNGLRQDVLQ